MILAQDPWFPYCTAWLPNHYCMSSLFRVTVCLQWFIAWLDLLYSVITSTWLYCIPILFTILNSIDHCCVNDMTYKDLSLNFIMKQRDQNEWPLNTLSVFLFFFFVFLHCGRLVFASVQFFVVASFHFPFSNLEICLACFDLHKSAYQSHEHHDDIGRRKWERIDKNVLIVKKIKKQKQNQLQISYKGIDSNVKSVFNNWTVLVELDLFKFSHPTTHKCVFNNRVHEKNKRNKEICNYNHEHDRPTVVSVSIIVLKFSPKTKGFAKGNVELTLL